MVKTRFYTIIPALAMVVYPQALFGFLGFGSGSADPDKVDKEGVKQKLKELQILEHDEQGITVKNSGADLSKEALLAFYKNSSEKDTFITEVLKEYTPEKRQELINGLLEDNTYKQLMINISSAGCKVIGDQANPFYFGALPIVDWINTANFKGFFRPAMKEALTNRDLYNEFDTFNQLGLWVEPFGFYTQFRREDKFLQFNQYTVGLSVGGEYTFFDRLVLGLGAAYSYSGVNWAEQKDSQASVNTLYFGPTLSYVFEHGYLGCSLLGVANLYHVARNTNLFPKQILEAASTVADYMSWDLDARIEGGLSYSPGGDFYFDPTARIDYLNVFEQEASEQLDDDTELTVDGLNESFLCTKIGLKISREFFRPALGFFIPSLSAGWINFTPLSTQGYHFHVNDCQNLQKEVKVDGWSQYYVGAAFEIVHKRGILIALDYELTAGENSPLQAGHLRVEFSW